MSLIPLYRPITEHDKILIRTLKNIYMESLLHSIKKNFKGKEADTLIEALDTLKIDYGYYFLYDEADCGLNPIEGYEFKVKCTTISQQEPMANLFLLINK